MFSDSALNWIKFQNSDGELGSSLESGAAHVQSEGAVSDVNTCLPTKYLLYEWFATNVLIYLTL